MRTAHPIPIEAQLLQSATQLVQHLTTKRILALGPVKIENRDACQWPLSVRRYNADANRRVI